MTTTPTVWKGATRVSVIETPGAQDQYDAKIVQLTTGDFLILFTANSLSTSAPDSGTNILAQGFDGQGNTIFETFQVHGSTLRNDVNVAVAALPDGECAITYESRDRDTGESNLGVTHLLFFDEDGYGWTSSLLAVDPGAT